MANEDGRIQGSASSSLENPPATVKAVVPRLLSWAQPRIDARIDELLELVGLPRGYRTRWWALAGWAHRC
jgi:hypothetical protein